MRTPFCKNCLQEKTLVWKPYKVKNKAGKYDEFVKRNWICKECQTESKTKTIKLP